MKRDVIESREVVTPRGAGARSASVAFNRAQLRQLLVITAVAAAIYATLRLLPTGTNLNHMDFRAQGSNSIEFCDPLNPQFIPVVAARSPVTLTARVDKPPVAGEMVRGVVTLRTSSGKPITPEDLLVVHTRALHLMIVDPSLTDYQHVHPEPGRTAGEWSFEFTPRASGTYRLFADFTPMATGRGLYASTDVEIGGAAAGTGGIEASASPALATMAQRNSRTEALPQQQEIEGYRYELVPSANPVRARQPVDYTFRVVALDGGSVAMAPVMGAFAHLVAFDTGRTGFAHLHPAQADPLQPPDATRPVLNFKLTIPSAGRYVIWSQVNIAGQERFVPFWFEVSE